jgi:hypothetical protein
VLDLTPASEDDFFWEFARAESDSPRFGPSYERALGGALLARLASDDQGGLTETDRASIRSAVLGVRGGYVSSLVGLGVRWYRGHLPIQELLNVRVLRLPAFTNLAPSRRLSEFVDMLDSGNLTQGDDFGANYARVRPRFDPKRSRGLPVVVADNVLGPYLEIEGLTRMAVLVSRFMREKVPLRVPMMLGVCTRLTEWGFA